MEFVLLALLVLVVILQIVALVMRPKSSADSSALQPLLNSAVESSEQRIKDELRNTRLNLEQATRDEAKGLAERFAQQTLTLNGMKNDQALALTAMKSELVTQLQDRFRGVTDHLDKSLTESRREQAEKLDRVQAALIESTKKIDSAVEQQQTQLIQLREAITTQSKDSAIQMTKALTESLSQLREAITLSLSSVQETVNSRLDVMQKGNEEKLEKMRATVEEKLQSTLETRLGESFRIVSEQLRQVTEGLGEMRNLASGVGDLKRVLVNTKMRGGVGEVQLQNLLDQVLVPEQYEKQVKLSDETSDLCDFAIKLPGKDDDGKNVFLPIDAKFPMEDYEKLQQAYDRADQQETARLQNDLAKRVESMAKSISSKYIHPPTTTDFAMLFLPTEGLYAEIVRRPGFMEKLQREQKIIIVGPTTLFAVLTSLSMGFRTLAIEKRSSEVWQILSAVKTEFGKFGGVIEDVQKKLNAASKTIDTVGVRSRAIERRLRGVEALDGASAEAVLGSLPNIASDEAEEE